MEVVLQRFDSNYELSVEDCVKKAVEGMSGERRLETAMELMGIGLEQEERLQEVVSETWGLIVREEWWRVRYGSLTEFMRECGMSESVKDLVRRRMGTERLKRKFESTATRRWGGRELKEVLGDVLMPTRLSKGFLEAIKGFAKEVKDVDEARELLSGARNRRLKRRVRGVRYDERLRSQDVKEAMREARGRPPKRSQIMETEEGEEEEQSRSERERTVEEEGSERERTVEEEGSGREPTVEEEEVSEVAESETMRERDSRADRNGNEVERQECECARQGTLRVVEHARNLFKWENVDKKLEMLATIDWKIWERMCYGHIKVLAGEVKLDTRGLDKKGLLARLKEAMRDRDSPAGAENGYEQSGFEGRAEGLEERLGPFKYVGVVRPELRLDRDKIWERYAAVGAMEMFLEDGNVVVPGVFDWIVKDGELRGMADAEFEMYRHHLRNEEGAGNDGRCRNMWHSLVQQAMRQDPVFYALNVAARPDRNWRLVSFPYFTKYGKAGDGTACDDTEIDVEQLCKWGRGASTVRTAVSMDDEFADGCSTVVPGFQRQIREWWREARSRGSGSDSMEDMYSKEDEARYGEFVRVVCGRGDMRMSLAQLMHGSTGDCVRVRRVVEPWLMGVDSNHDRLEMKECGSWEEVSAAHRNMWAMKVGPTGQKHEFPVGEGRFAGSIEMRGMSAIGDALVGARRWDSRAVLSERDLILGSDDGEAWKYVGRVRKRVKEEWKRCFKTMVEAEASEYGEKAYFNSIEGLCSVAAYR